MYVFSFLGEYIRYGHDKAPSEIEADKGRKKFGDFNEFVNNKYGADSLLNLFNSNASEEDKISKIDEWWNCFLESQKINE